MKNGNKPQGYMTWGAFWKAFQKNDLRNLNPCPNCGSKGAPTVVLFGEEPVEIKMRKHYLYEWKTVTCLKSKGGCGVSSFYFQDYDRLVDAYNKSSEKGV